MSKKAASHPVMVYTFTDNAVLLRSIDKLLKQNAAFAVAPHELGGFILSTNHQPHHYPATK